MRQTLEQQIGASGGECRLGLGGQAVGLRGRANPAGQEHRGTHGAEVICWSAVHGFAVLHVHGPRASAPVEERNATLEVMLDHIARGLA